MLRRTSFNSEASKKNVTRKELRVLFVSKHDACRGPMADCIFQSIADRHAMKSYSRFLYRSASAGINRHNPGNLPEQLALRVLSENDLDTVHGCRQVSLSDYENSFLIENIHWQIRLFDFTRYDYILCMEPGQWVKSDFTQDRTQFWIF